MWVYCVWLWWIRAARFTSLPLHSVWHSQWPLTNENPLLGLISPQSPFIMQCWYASPYLGTKWRGWGIFRSLQVVCCQWVWIMLLWAEKLASFHFVLFFKCQLNIGSLWSFRNTYCNLKPQNAVMLLVWVLKVKGNISKMQDLAVIIIYMSLLLHSPSGSCINKMIIMSVMLHLEYDFIIPKNNYQSENWQQLNSYWLPWEGTVIG